MEVGAGETTTSEAPQWNIRKSKKGRRTVFRGSATSNLPSRSVGVARAMSDITISLISVEHTASAAKEGAARRTRVFAESEVRPIRRQQRNQTEEGYVRKWAVVCRNAENWGRTVDSEHAARACKAAEAKDDVRRTCHDGFLANLCPLEAIELARIVAEHLRVLMDCCGHGGDKVSYGRRETCQSCCCGVLNMWHTHLWE